MAKLLEEIDFFDFAKKSVKFHSGKDADSKIVLDFFKDNTSGKFLCIGANNGLDVTNKLLKLGWHGVYCEPDPYACTELLENTKEFVSQVTIFNVAITADSNIQKFYVSIGNSFISSIKPGWAENQTIFKNTPIRSIIINTVGFKNLLDFLDTKFDYIQIDVEGLDAEIISSIDWSLVVGCKMICTESGPTVFKQLYKQNKFMITDVTDTNSFYIKKK